MTSETDPKGDPVIDQAGLLEQFEGDRDLINEIAQLFCEEGPNRLAAMRRALAQGDAPALVLAAHSLKGSATNFCARGAAAVARDLEILARGGDLSAAPALCDQLALEIGKLMEALACLRRKTEP
jgi:two-component system sensor histidine kinase/response regulator